MSSFLAISIILFLRTLPFGFVGNPSTTFIYLGILKWAILPVQNSLTSSIVNLQSCLSLNQAQTSSPTRSSGTPTTFTSITFGWVRKKASTSAGYIFAPNNL